MRGIGCHITIHGAAAGHRRGFALVVTITLMVLIATIGLGVLSLSATSLRSAGALQWQQQARDNARLALTIAVGELQRELGPDRRVSGEAGMLSGEAQPVAQAHWTAAWPTHAPDGRPVVRRDPASGSLLDVRARGDWARDKQAAFLVSGNEGGVDRFRPEAPPTGAAAVELVGAGSVGGDAAGRVVVPRVAINASQGAYAWWVGDLGVRANLASGAAPPPADANPLVSRRAELALLDPPLPLGDEARGRLVTPATTALVSDRAALRARFHDLTVESLGVLADPLSGGLKRDLTAFLNGGGRVPALAGGSGLAALGLADDDRLAGPANAEAAAALGEVWDGSPFTRTAPRFGILRSWARIDAESGERAAAVIPKSEPRPRIPSLTGFASSNLNPASIAEFDRANMAPVLVEGSLMSTVSFHRTPPEGDHPYQIRLHVYPRVALWNPYNVTLDVPDTMAVIQVNGRKETRMEGILERRVNGQWQSTGSRVISRGIWFVGGRSTQFFDNPDILQSTGYRDPYIGSFYFALAGVRLEPGECVVFSTEAAREYDRYNLANNRLSPEVGPQPSRSFSFSSSEINGGIMFRPDRFWEKPPDKLDKMIFGPGLWDIRNQADDCRVVLKQRTGGSFVDFGAFDALPQVGYLSVSLQYGAGREPRISWADGRPMAIEETDRLEPRPTVVPDVRTRQGIRLRWFRETLSNQINAGPLGSTPHFQDAPLANWNPRAAYALRSPWENIAGPLPADNANIGGDAVGGPWFFGTYTRDLFDPEVDWNNSMPVRRNNRYHGNPFGPPIEAVDRYVVFDVAPDPGRIVSLAAFQHAKLSEFVWHPSLVVGQSLVDPRCGLTRTVPQRAAADAGPYFGWNQRMIGWSSDVQRAQSADEWAAFGRGLLQDLPRQNVVVYDLSYEVNQALWDAYFLSGGDPAAKVRFVQDPLGSPLPNPRLRPHAFGGAPLGSDHLADFHRAAAHLLVDGAFNVNSTSVDAWLALLSATRGLGGSGGTPIPRLADAPERAWDGRTEDEDKVWAGGRELSDDELRQLAEAIVAEVRARGPFLGLADFVNRRLSEDAIGRSGALQAAIDRAGINRTLTASWPLDNARGLPDYRHPDNIDDPTLLDQRLKPETSAWGAPGHLTQGDLLQVIGPALAARSDSFVVRAYGEALDAGGRVQARAWCEAVVQRLPEPVLADATGLNPLPVADGRTDFGRRFVVRRFRWLQPGEV